MYTSFSDSDTIPFHFFYRIDMFMLPFMFWYVDYMINNIFLQSFIFYIKFQVIVVGVTLCNLRMGILQNQSYFKLLSTFPQETSVFERGSDISTEQ